MGAPHRVAHLCMPHLSLSFSSLLMLRPYLCRHDDACHRGEAHRHKTLVNSCPPADNPDAASTSEKTARGYRGRCMFARGVIQFVHRRGQDIASMGLLILCYAIGYVYVTREILESEGAALSSVLSKACHVIFVLCLASWAGITYHGPGRERGQEEMQCSDLPPPLADAIAAVGAVSKRPFTSVGVWCSECGCWKSALAHHCSVCQRCSLWMDHHCFFTGQCIGFRNLRCAIVWLSYLLLLLVLLSVAALYRVFAGPPMDKWAYMRLSVSAVLAAGASKAVWVNLSDYLKQLSTGWPSFVMLTKFRGVQQRASTLGKDMEKLSARIHEHPPALKPLAEAYAGITWKGDRHNIRGLFLAAGIIEALAQVFGEPCSWRWLLPLLPGGSGDPRRPVSFNAEVCSSWRSLAAIVHEHEAALEREEEQEVKKACEQSAKVSSFLATIGKIDAHTQ
eukprot:TRINITY_DN12365_c0_g3_i1.p1 TRINITY_DN12365_c0_g3~~TRINITY_DN12365_c0_g3_i1.p1  ORF type:complete len:450 (-),score=61.55 TRINITY_DN12365_c0_g3_i1:279-1628(-)